LKPNLNPEKSLWSLYYFQKIDALKRKLKPENTASSKKRKVESLLTTEYFSNLTTRSDEGEDYFLTSFKLLSTIKKNLAKHLTHEVTTELGVSLIINHEEHLLRALTDTSASSSSILEAYSSGSIMKTDDINTTTWSKIGCKFTTTKTGIFL
jgi:hypothetical protein